MRTVTEIVYERVDPAPTSSQKDPVILSRAELLHRLAFAALCGAAGATILSGLLGLGLLAAAGVL